MAIPTYQQCMKPVLEYASHNDISHFPDAVEYLSDNVFKLSEDEKAEVIPSGTQTVISSRCGWARTYMTKALLLDSPKKGYFKITERGKQFLSVCGDSFGTNDLLQFEEFRQFRSLRRDKSDKISTPIEDEDKNEMTPDEALDFGEEKLNENLASDLLEKVKKSSPAFFEQVVVKLLVKMGYGGSFSEAARVVGKSGDGGIDGIIKEDKLGLDEIYVQAKRWDNNTVGRPEIQKFVGALMGQNANKGVFVTTSSFSKDAEEFAAGIKNQKIILIDGAKLASLMIEYNLGINVIRTIEIKKIDSDFFDEGEE